jgi:peptide chain release factor 2
MAPSPPPADDAELLAQCDLETFRSSGKGGQHVNKTESAVRLRHRPTGIAVVCGESRSQWRNRQLCLQRLRRKLEALSRPVKPRKATSKPRAAKRRNLETKARHSEKKKRRLRPGREDA